LGTDVDDFTQLVWKDTTKVGVGIALNDAVAYVVAKYLKAGNIPGGYPKNVACKKGKSIFLSNILP